MRRIFYDVKLRNLTETTKLPISVATTDINNLEPLLKSNEVFFKVQGFTVDGFELSEIRYSLYMTEEQYISELEQCHIRDDI